MPTATRDFSALVAPVDRAEVAAFRRQSIAAGRLPSQRATLDSALLTVAVTTAAFMVATIAGTTLARFVRTSASASSRQDGSADALSGAIAPAIFIIVAIVVAIFIVRTIRWERQGWVRFLRQERFAAANGLRFSPEDWTPRYPGAIFQQGTGHRSTDHFVSPGPPLLDVGNFTRTIGVGRTERTQRWGFLALRLERDLPHMMLDARATVSLFPQSDTFSDLRRDQVLSLEGDFDRYFTLYCPTGYERDALYVFTPDLMALLIDNAAEFDVEIVDRWMFVYSPRRFDMADAGTLRRLLRIADTVGAKTLARTDGYRDDRTSAAPPADGRPAVAPAGRRLRRKYSFGAIGVIALAVGYFYVPYVARALFG